jgi:hypothetical protein
VPIPIQVTVYAAALATLTRIGIVGMSRLYRLYRDVLLRVPSIRTHLQLRRSQSMARCLSIPHAQPCVPVSQFGNI